MSPYSGHFSQVPWCQENTGLSVTLICNYLYTGLYCSGWVKRGPIGTILTTMNDAFETAEAIAHDIANGMNE